MFAKFQNGMFSKHSYNQEITFFKTLKKLDILNIQKIMFS